MASFFEKLKKGMGIEEKNEEENEEERIEEKPAPAKPKLRKPKKLEMPGKPIEDEIKRPAPIKTTAVEEEKEEKVEIKETAPAKEPTDQTFAWQNLGGQEGQLAVDVYQTESELVIQSAIAGIKPEDLDISMERDILTIIGERKKPFEEEGDYFSQECYWGKFSRQLILPVEVDPNKIEATLKGGILTVRIPKILRERKRRVIVKG